MERTIFLVDMNSYFAAVEQVANPALRGKPIVVCGQGRTVVTTASYEARAFGVKTGMNLYEARRCCPHLIPVCGNLDKYIDTSLRIHRILLRFTDQVEAFSIDECFMDLTGLCPGADGPRQMARAVKQAVHAALGLRCSIGVGPNKLVAKIASKMQKPDGLVVIREEDVPRVFATLPIESLQGAGIGRKIGPQLRSLGITTAGELGAAAIDKLTTYFGIPGYYLKNLGQGIDHAPVKRYGESEPVKSVGHSRTLPRDTGSSSVITSYLVLLAEKVGTRLREEKLQGKTVTLTVRYADFTTFSRQNSLNGYIRESAAIYQAARAIFKTLLPLQKPVRLLGVSISQLAPEDGQQFLLEEMARRETLTATVDALNHKFGTRTLKPAALLIAEKFGMEARCGMFGKYWLKKGKQ
jgi:DNA polymerase-4